MPVNNEIKERVSFYSVEYGIDFNYNAIGYEY